MMRTLVVPALVVASSVARADGTMPSVPAAEADCAAEERVDERFANGARWELCVESRVRENLVLKHVTYTPPGGEPFPVLASASLAQLHVAYDDNDVTYNDITQYGLGGGYLVELDEADCPYGTLMTVSARPAICLWRRTGADGYRSAARALDAESVNLFSVSQVGAYAYVQSWTFRDDGAIEPGLGASGALQRSGDDTTLPFGRVLSGDPDTLWLSHTHNYHWRLDFDVGALADDDIVTETRYPLGPDGRRARERIRFARETARVIEPDALQAWHVWEGTEDPTAGDAPGAEPVAPAAGAATGGPAALPRGYRIEPERTGHRFVRTDVEPHTGFDVFVTVARDCERFASQNARYEPDCPDDVLQYADAEPLDGADVVLWHRVGFHHVPRDEDQRHMHTHWDGFTIEPVNLSGGEATAGDAANGSADEAAGEPAGEPVDASPTGLAVASADEPADEPADAPAAGSADAPADDASSPVATSERTSGGGSTTLALPLTIASLLWWRRRTAPGAEDGPRPAGRRPYPRRPRSAGSPVTDSRILGGSTPPGRPR